MSFKMFKFGIALVIFGVVGMIRADESSPNPVVPIVSLVNAINADGKNVHFLICRKYREILKYC